MTTLSLQVRIATLSLLFAVSAAHAHDDDADGKGILGKVSFANTCDAKVQEPFQRAVAMLHSFWYSAAEATFRDVLARDPQCAIAGWGIASILMNNPLAGVGAAPKDAEKAQAAIDSARKSGAGSQREKDYIEAVAAYYQDFGNRSERSRQESRSKAYETLAARYPDDDEAQIFSALYLAGTQSQADQTYAAYLRAASVLEKMFVKYPDHPGVAHYLIHSYDAPPIAKQGVVAARRYASIAPAAPHAQHMPSHIFTRVGAWEDSIAANTKSYEYAIKGGEPDEAYHASDYAVYANLQIARDADARKAMESALKVTGASPARPTAPYASSAMPARYALERGAWREAMDLPPPTQPSRFQYTDATTWYAKALGAARAGHMAAAEQSAEQLVAIHKALLEAKNNYWATEVEVERLTVAGWIALGKKEPDNALKFMRAAADLEDRNEKHIITPGRMLPARELLGDMLMEMQQPALALKEYELSQEREPNRFRGLHGAASAAAAAGDRAKAAAFYAKLLEQSKGAEGTRPELTAARAFVAAR